MSFTPNTITRIEPGHRMSKAVIHNGTVYVSGQVAAVSAGKSVTEQTTEVLTLIDAALSDAGTDKSKLLFATIYLTDISTFGDMNTVWEQWVVPGHTPARATLEAKLVTHSYAVEIVVIAAV